MADIVDDLLSADHARPIDPKAVYRTRDVALFNRAAGEITALRLLVAQGGRRFAPQAAPGRPSAKLYIVMRSDLRMGRGKEIAQAIHAFRSMDPDAHHEVYDGMAVIGLRADSAAELEAIIDEAHGAGQRWGTFLDAGVTHNEPGTRTCAAIGPTDKPGPLLSAARLY